MMGGGLVRRLEIRVGLSNGKGIGKGMNPRFIPFMPKVTPLGTLEMAMECGLARKIRMNREIHIRICESLGAQSPGLLDRNPCKEFNRYQEAPVVFPIYR